MSLPDESNGTKRTWDTGHSCRRHQEGQRLRRRDTPSGDTLRLRLARLFGLR